MTNFYGARNNVSAKIPTGGSYTAGAGSITVDDASGFLYTDGTSPSATKPILVSTSLADGTPKGVYRCEAKTGNTLTLTAFVSGIDASLTAGALVEMRHCAEHAGQVAAAVNTLESASGAGTVTSVALAMPGVIFNATVPGSPVTTSGTLAPTLATQTANTILAGPTSGGAVAPTFRTLVAADVPALDASKITTGLIAPARLGTGTPSGSTYLRGDQTYATPTAGPGGADTQVQFNDAGVMAGSSLLTFAKASGLLTMSGVLLNNASILCTQFGDYGNAKGYILTNTAGRNWDFGNRVTGNIQIVIAAIAGQTADQLQLRNSAGVVNFAFDKLNRPYTGGNVPAIAAGAGAGTSPTVSIAGSDMAGTITITTGTSPTAGATVATVTFSAAWAAVPRGVTITPVGPNAALVMATSPFYEDQASRSTTAFNVKVAGATALAASTTYLLGYRVDG